MLKMGKYKHYKGGIYTAIHTARHTETDDWLVIYQSEGGQIWARPIEMWTEKVNVNGEWVSRFSYIGD